MVRNIKHVDSNSAMPRELFFIASTGLSFLSMMALQSNVLSEEHFFHSFPIRKTVLKNLMVSSIRICWLSSLISKQSRNFLHFIQRHGLSKNE